MSTLLTRVLAPKRNKSGVIPFVAKVQATVFYGHNRLHRNGSERALGSIFVGDGFEFGFHDPNKIMILQFYDFLDTMNGLNYKGYTHFIHTLCA